jgi:hypothetical protein
VQIVNANDPANLVKVKVGDEMVITCSEAVSSDVQSPVALTAGAVAALVAARSFCLKV